jgi:hypothetical protein
MKRPVIHMPGMVSTTCAVMCARCGLQRSHGPAALGIDIEISATRFAYQLKMDGWQHRKLSNGPEKSLRPLWICPNCEAAQ